jgi:hypothetical protein
MTSFLSSPAQVLSKVSLPGDPVRIGWLREDYAPGKQIAKILGKKKMQLSERCLTAKRVTRGLKRRN